ncbi:MAG TPA: hypothetical protein VND54_06850 [Candidatus Saccharimonadales bacterium]|nr:hypothetical protein [Candidatus Saccharimonadales bacterium]
MRPATVLAGVIAAAAIAGFAISTLQRSPRPAPPQSAPPSPAPTPVPRGPISGIGFAVADDPAAAQVVLFGGAENDDNTWVWSGGQWSLAEPATSPPGRVDAAAAYDPQTKQVLLFGGRHNPLLGGPSLNDTWAWNGKMWRELDSGTNGPPPGEGSSMAWDGALDEMILVNPGGGSPGNGQTWVWSGSRWTLKIHGAVAPNAFDLPIGFDPITRSLIAEGCCYVPRSPLGALDTTWSWDGERWQQLAGTAEPLPGSALALNPSTGRLALCNCGPMVALPVLESWTGRTWVLMNIARLPLEPVAEISDATSGQLLVFGSATPSSQSVAQPVHVWALNGSTWRQLDATTG